jgi:hypothetical protein
MRWNEVALRLMLVVGLLVAIAYNAAVWITAPIGLLAISATAELAVRPYARNGIDRLLLACGGTVTVLILVGLGLNLTPMGLTRTTWAAAWAFLSVGILIWRRDLRTQGLGSAALRLRSLWLWIGAASVVLLLGIVLALAGVRYSNRQPVMALALESTNGHAITVEVDATSTAGRYRIAASTASGTHRYLGAVFSITAGPNGGRVLERVPTSASGVWTIQLESAASGAVLRSLIVDVH